MSASYLVDLFDTAELAVGISSTGTFYPASGLDHVTGISDMLQANSFTNLFVAGRSMFSSGQQRVCVQTSDSIASGTFTDPTSGLAQMPTSFQSGGYIVIGSGVGGTNANQPDYANDLLDFGPGTGLQPGLGVGGYNSSQYAQSGFFAAAGFQRPHRYVRAWVISGNPAQFIQAIGFVGQFKTTGSGGGFTFAPSSGVVNV